MLGRLVVIGLAVVLAPAGASVVPRPALGDWEGVGPNGLPLTFVLAKGRRHLVLHNLAVGFPVNCPRKPTPWIAIAYLSASYSGPGAQPRVGLPSWRPTDITIEAPNGRTFPLTLSGRLLSHRRAVLSMPASPREPKNCGWPKKAIVWKLRPASRIPVAVGTWTGTATLPDGGGSVTAQVIAAGRLVNVFKMKLTCAQGGDLTVQAGPPAGEFISASGAFEGWGYAHWKGRFGRGGTLTGTFRSADPCGQSDQLDGTFTATRASARAPSTR